MPVTVNPDRLSAAVRFLAGERHPIASPERLAAAESYIALELDAAGLRVERQLFEFRGREYHNVVGTLDGTDPAREMVVVGAHFDSVAGSPGADDNASGVAVLLEAARVLAAASSRLSAPVQFVGFNLEEAQDWRGRYRVGSIAYARMLRARRVALAGALVLEMVGYTDGRPRSQVVPAVVSLVKRVPRTGTFLAAVGERRSRRLLAQFERAARGVAGLTLVTYRVPLGGWLVPDTRLSDNTSFWEARFPALMLTDTAYLRNPHYHRPSDVPETLDYGFMARVTDAVVAAVELLAS